MPAVAGFFVGAFGGAGLVVPGALAGGVAAGATLAASTFGGLAVNLLSSVALSALSIAIQGKPSVPGLRTTQTLTGGVNPETFVLGRYATNGAHVCPPLSHGEDNKFLTYVIELAGIPGHTLDALILNGAPVDIEADDPHADYGQRIGGDYDGFAWIRYHDGTQTTADAMLLAKYPAPYVRPWSSTMVGAGICYAVLTFKMSRKIWQGFPSVRFVLGGVPLYDPRLDDTAGGTGDHRYGDPSTYSQTENAAVIAYNVLRGVVLPGGEVWGGGIPAADLPYSDWAAQMDLADDPVTDGDEGTEPQYRAGIEVQANDEPFAVVDLILTAASGALAEDGGVWLARFGPPGLPVLFIEDGDIIADEPEEFAPFPSLDQVYNAITATHPDPSASWESTEIDLITNTDLEAQDGGRQLVASVSLVAAPYPVQVQRVAHALIADHRRMARHVLTLPPFAAILSPLDTISWTSDANGYLAKSFEVVDVVRDLRTQLVRVSLREVDPNDYDLPPDLSRPTPIDPTPDRPGARLVEGFAVAAVAITDGTEDRRPAISATWDPDAAPDARGVRVAMRRAGQTGDGDELPVVATEAGGVVISAVLPNVTYELRAIYDVDRATDWTTWAAATTGDIRIGSGDLDDEIGPRITTLGEWIGAGITDLPGDLSGLIDAIEDEVEARVEAIEDQAELIGQQADALIEEQETRIAETREAAKRWRDQRETIRALAAEVLDLGARDHLAREEIRRSLTVQLGDQGADFAEQILVLIDEQSSTAARVTTLEATGEDLSAQITLAELARQAGDEALAALVAAVAVGTATQFDHTGIYYFDSSVEGWTGSPNAPTAAGGYLIPGAASYVASPTGLDVDGGVYGQVRARIQRIGSPTWQGYLWWADEGEGWDAGRRVTLAEPTFTDDVALITWTPGWTGTVDAIRVDLASGADGSNYYQIDWIAVGRPAPGASSAELLTEQSARITADSALATSVTALESRLTTAEDGVTGNSTAISALDARVEDTEDGLVAVAERVTDLETTVDDPETGVAATAAALDVLTTQVELLDDGSQVVQAGAIRALESRLRRVAAENIDANARGQLQTQLIRDYVANASQSLNTRIDATDDEVTVIAEAVTLLQAEIPGLATATALAALTATVIEHGEDIAAQSTAITDLSVDLGDLETEVGTKASASAVTALDVRVTSAEGAISSQGTAITQLDVDLEDLGDEVATKASASALTALDVRVTAAEGTISSQGTAITQLGADLGDLETEVDTKASASALTALDVRVTAAEGEISSQGTAITQLGADLEDLGEEVDTKASASAVTALDVRVTAAEGAISSQGTAITQLGADLGDLEDEVATKAAATALTALEVRVTEAEGEISSLSTAVTAIEAEIDDIGDDLATKASASAVTALEVRVTEAEGDIATQSSAITALDSRIEDAEGDIAGQATAITALDTRVTETEDGVEALASAITQISAGTDDGVIGSITFKMEVQTGPLGYARIGAQARVGSEETDEWRAAGWFVDVPNNPLLPTLFVIQADTFAVTDGTTTEIPFYISGGVVRIDWARIDNVTIEYAEISGAFQTANYIEDSEGVAITGVQIDVENDTFKIGRETAREGFPEKTTYDEVADVHEGRFYPAVYNTFVEAVAIELTDLVLGQIWRVDVAAEVRRVEDTFFSGGTLYNISWDGDVRLERRHKKNSGDAYSSWVEIRDGSLKTGDGSWKLVTTSDSMCAAMAGVQYRVTVRNARNLTWGVTDPPPASGDIPPDPGMARDLAIVAEIKRI